jgi:hypothetical protein
MRGTSPSIFKQPKSFYPAILPLGQLPDHYNKLNFLPLRRVSTKHLKMGFTDLLSDAGLAGRFIHKLRAPGLLLIVLRQCSTTGC